MTLPDSRLCESQSEYHKALLLGKRCMGDYTPGASFVLGNFCMDNTRTP